MKSYTRYFAAAAAIGALSAPALAQTAYPYGYQQPYPQYQQQYPQQGYPQQTYGYNQGYATGNPVTDIIDGLLGNRYNVTDRQAVRQCANAAMTQATSQYGNGYGAYGERYGQQYGQGYNRHAAMRVTAITDVQRRQNGLRVSGLMNSGVAYGGQYGQYGQYGYQSRSYAQGDLSFRCNVDYRGQVSNIRIGHNNAYRG